MKGTDNIFKGNYILIFVQFFDIEKSHAIVDKFPLLKKKETKVLNYHNKSFFHNLRRILEFTNMD